MLFEQLKRLVGSDKEVTVTVNGKNISKLTVVDIDTQGVLLSSPTGYNYVIPLSNIDFVHGSDIFDIVYKSELHRLCTSKEYKLEELTDIITNYICSVSDAASNDSVHDYIEYYFTRFSDEGKSRDWRLDSLINTLNGDLTQVMENILCYENSKEQSAGYCKEWDDITSLISRTSFSISEYIGNKASKSSEFVQYTIKTDINSGFTLKDASKKIETLMREEASVLSYRVRQFERSISSLEYSECCSTYVSNLFDKYRDYISFVVLDVSSYLYETIDGLNIEKCKAYIRNRLLNGSKNGYSIDKIVDHIMAEFKCDTDKLISEVNKYKE